MSLFDPCSIFLGQNITFLSCLQGPEVGPRPEAGLPGPARVLHEAAALCPWQDGPHHRGGEWDAAEFRVKKNFIQYTVVVLVVQYKSKVSFESFLVAFEFPKIYATHCCIYVGCCWYTWWLILHPFPSLAHSESIENRILLLNFSPLSYLAITYVLLPPFHTRSK